MPDSERGGAVLKGGAIETQRLKQTGNDLRPVSPGSQQPPQWPPHRPAWHDITTAEKVGMILASVILPPVGVFWGIAYSLALETARRRWGHYALALSSATSVIGLLAALLLLARGQ